jgi:Bacterial extracellular solute-binding proteins, family 5 Middle
LCLGAAYCGPPAARLAPPAPVLPGGADACALSSAAGTVPETLSVALTGTVDPRNAPVARNAAERFVFRQLYETLIRVDCQGQPQPGLARSWASAESGHDWTFTLRPDATFWDGLPVTASDVAAAWRDASRLPAGVTVLVRGERELGVRFSHATSVVPSLLADPAWSVAKPVAGDAWPMGTGAFRPDTAGGHFTLVPLVGARPTVEIRSRDAGDMRDLLDAGVDLLVTGEPAPLSYAADRTDLTTVPLPWDSTYILLAQGTIAISAGVRVGLARDAVRVDARPAEGPYWWADPAGCDLEPPPGAGATPFQPVHPVWTAARGDPPARDLTDRLVALGLTGGDTAVRAVTLEPDAFAAALAAGRSAGYVLAVPRHPLAPCGAMRELVARAPWLPGGVIVALVDTRRHVIVRRGAGAFTVDWDGTLRLR